MKSFQIIEILGMALVLFSVGWEVFFSQTIESIERDIEAHRLHYKLDQLHYRQFQIKEHIDYKVHQLEIHQDVPGVQTMSDQWNPSPYDESLKRVSKQSQIFWYIKTVLFAVGSLLLIVAKLIEYSQRT